MKVFVTVGTTKFDDLITCVCSKEIQSILASRGFKKLILQTGKTKPDLSCCVLECEDYDYKSSIFEDMLQADLIISHAGAGTCLEVLGYKKKLIVVVNEKLMDNHQSELAEKLADCGYVDYSSVNNLATLLQTCSLTPTNYFPQTDKSLFQNFLMKQLNMI